MEEEIEALNKARARQQRRSTFRRRNLLEKIAQPREVLIMRGSILAILVIAFALSVYSRNQSTDDCGIISFWDITSYRYCFVTIVFGITYNIVALLLNLLQYYVPDINSKILFDDDQPASKEAGSLLNMGKAVSSFLVSSRTLLVFITST